MSKPRRLPRCRQQPPLPSEAPDIGCDAAARGAETPIPHRGSGPSQLERGRLSLLWARLDAGFYSDPEVLAEVARRIVELGHI